MTIAYKCLYVDYSVLISIITFEGPPLPTQFKVDTLNNSLVLLTWKISPETDNSSFKELSSVTVVWCKGTLPNICFVSFCVYSLRKKIFVYCYFLNKCYIYA